MIELELTHFKFSLNSNLRQRMLQKYTQAKITTEMGAESIKLGETHTNINYNK